MAYIGSKPADKALTGADIEDGTIQIADLAATGTKDVTTFLRGDGTFASAGGTNTPAFYGEKASDQTLTRATTTKITGFTSNEIDSNTAFDGTTFTVPSGQAGKYLIHVGLEFNYTSVGNDGEQNFIFIYKNGSSIKTAANQNIDGKAMRIMVNITAILDLSATDYIEVYANGVDLNGGGGGKILATNSSFSGYKLIGV